MKTLYYFNFVAKFRFLHLKLDFLIALHFLSSFAFTDVSYAFQLNYVYVFIKVILPAFGTM